MTDSGVSALFHYFMKYSQIIINGWCFKILKGIEFLEVVHFNANYQNQADREFWANIFLYPQLSLLVIPIMVFLPPSPSASKRALRKASSCDQKPCGFIQSSSWILFILLCRLSELCSFSQASLNMVIEGLFLYCSILSSGSFNNDYTLHFKQSLFFFRTLSSSPFSYK